MEVEQLTKNIIKLVKTTGSFIRNESMKVNRRDAEKKGLHDYVTYVDKSAEEKLTLGLSQLLPGSGFITEEDTTEDNHNETYTWIIDPLDGTTNYIHSVPLYSISIALQRNGKTILGVVYEIIRDECFYTWEGSPPYMNGQQLAVSDTDKLNDSLLATGFPYYDYSRIQPYMKLFEYFMQNSLGIRRLGSTAVDLAYVACGRFDGFYEYSLHAWDVAAGAFLVQQAGGNVCDFSGGDNYLFGGEIIATNDGIHKPFMKAVKMYFD